MASKLEYLRSTDAALRRVLDEYVRLLGPGGITSYVASQDLLFVTDFNSLLALCPASRYVRMHKLRAVNIYTNRRAELPGAHILAPGNEYEPDDIRLKSLLSDKSIVVGDIIALAQAQANVDLSMRERLTSRYHAERDLAMFSGGRDTKVLVGRRYFEALLAPTEIRCYSGVVDNFNEPTVSWRDLPLDNKGVFFLANKTFYGLVMPHAKIDGSFSEDRDS